MGTKTIKFPDGTTKDAEVNSFFVGTEQQYNGEIEQCNEHVLYPLH